MSTKLDDLQAKQDKSFQRLDDRLATVGKRNWFTNTFHPARAQHDADKANSANRKAQDAMAANHRAISTQAQQNSARSADVLAKANAMSASLKAPPKTPAAAPAAPASPAPAAPASPAPAAPAPAGSPATNSMPADWRDSLMPRSAQHVDTGFPASPTPAAVAPANAAPSANPAARTTATAGEAGKPDITDYLNRELLSKGGPTHPSLGVFMGGKFRGLTPDQAREKLIAEHGKIGGGALQTGGLQSGGLQSSGLAGGNLATAGGSSEEGWRKLFPGAPGATNVQVDPANGLRDPQKPAAAAVPGSIAHSTGTGDTQSRSLIGPKGFGFASISPTNRPAPVAQSPAGVRPNLYIGDETGNRTAEFAKSLPETKGAGGFSKGIGTAPKADIRPFSPARPKTDELVA